MKVEACSSTKNEKLDHSIFLKVFLTTTAELLLCGTPFDGCEFSYELCEVFKKSHFFKMEIHSMQG